MRDLMTFLPIVPIVGLQICKYFTVIKINFQRYKYHKSLGCQFLSDGWVLLRKIKSVTENSTSMPHKMECVRVYQNSIGDLEFEYVCPECGYTEVLSLFDSFANGDFFVSHTRDVDGSSYLSINFQSEESEIPQCFKDFFESLEDDV
jgi:hypothetical protein